MPAKSVESLVRAAVLICLKDDVRLQRLIQRGAFDPVPHRQIIEMLLELHLFAGYPASIEGFKIFSPLLHKGGDAGVKTGESRGTRAKRGRVLCRRVYGSKFGSLDRHLKSLNPQLAQWILEDGYGRVLSRKGLSLRTREAIAVAVLAVLGWEVQLKSHVKGARNVGMSPTAIEKILKIVQNLAPRQKVPPVKDLLG